jgi:hypothetical protein
MSRAAERIAEVHNRVAGGSLTGGVLAFNHLGYGGEWFPANDHPAAAIIVPVQRYRMGVNEAQKLIDAYLETVQ